MLFFILVLMLFFPVVLIASIYFLLFLPESIPFGIND